MNNLQLNMIVRQIVHENCIDKAVEMLNRAKAYRETHSIRTKELSENNLNIYTCLICPVCRYNTLKYVSIPAVLCLTQNKLSCV